MDTSNEKYADELASTENVRDLMANSLRAAGKSPTTFFEDQGITKNFLWNIKCTYPNTIGTYYISRATNLPMEYFLTGKYKVPHYYEFMKLLDGISKKKAEDILVKLKQLI